MSGVIRLTITQESQKSERYTFENRDVVIVGSGDDCHIRLPNERGLISHHHFLLEVAPPQAQLRDLGSKNGTYINGQKTGGRPRGQDRILGSTLRFPEITLHDGDEIRVGDVVMRITIDMPTAQAVLMRCQRCQKLLDAPLVGDPLCTDCRKLIEDDSDTLRAMVEADTTLEIPVNTDYTFERKLGSGGNGVVYLVRHKVTGMPYALKMLLPKIALTFQAHAIFRREMEQMRALRHPNVVTLHDGGTGANLLCFLMEYCEFGSVEDLIRDKGPLGLNEALSIMDQTLDGLSVVHQRGIIHRDLKPQNLLLGKSSGKRVAKIGDWGLAKNIAQAGLSGLTVTGSFAGTPPFMPREQITHFKYIKPASDVWALGATFFYMLTGRYPRQGRPDQSPIEVVLYNDSIPIRQLRSDISPRLAAVIDRALSVDASERYPDAGEMRAAFSRAIDA